MPYIYKITNNITGDIYIGKTTYSVNKRWKQHLSNSKLENLKHLSLYKAMREYGTDNFSVSTVQKVENVEDLSNAEKYWVEHYNSYFNGYNETRGGGGSLLYDYDLIWELWENGLEIKEISKELNCNDFVVRTCLSCHNVSTEERISRSIHKQAETHQRYSRKVEQRDIKTGKLIATYGSAREAARAINGDSSNISKKCRTNGVGYGYRRNYTNDYYEKKNFSPRKINQIDLHTNEIIATYSSLSEAARAVDGDGSYIGKVCKGLQHSSKGYKWEFAV